MNTNPKDIRYDEDLRLEAYCFSGTQQRFPNHFHEYYVIGLIESGVRSLIVNNREYRIGPGDLMTFNPMDNHACKQLDGDDLNYLCLNINREVMERAAREVMACAGLPVFREPVQYRTELADDFRELHTCIMNRAPDIEKEELFLLLMEQLLAAYADLSDNSSPEPTRKEIDEVCAYLENHYPERITLEQLAHVAALNKYTLIRLFTRHKGITPYRYLETIRIGKAKKLLEQGIEPSDAAQRTGFSDQSHFTSFFSQLIGLSPGQYRAIFRESVTEEGRNESK